MKKQLSLFLASLFLMIGTAWAQTENNAADPSALAPTYSAPSTPVWNYVQFVESSNVLCDLGTGKVTTVAAEEVDNNMWAAVGSNEQFYLMSKLGNYLAYDAEKNCYKASANKKERVALTLKAVAGAWEIMRKGGDKVMSVITTDSVAEAATGAAANKVAFVDLTPKVYDPNVFSTWEAPVYYQVQFKAGGCYILDQGNGKKLTTMISVELRIGIRTSFDAL